MSSPRPPSTTAVSSEDLITFMPVNSQRPGTKMVPNASPGFMPCTPTAKSSLTSAAGSGKKKEGDPPKTPSDAKPSLQISTVRSSPMGGSPASHGPIPAQDRYFHSPTIAGGHGDSPQTPTRPGRGPGPTLGSFPRDSTDSRSPIGRTRISGSFQNIPDASKLRPLQGPTNEILASRQSPPGMKYDGPKLPSFASLTASISAPSQSPSLENRYPQGLPTTSPIRTSKPPEVDHNEVFRLDTPSLSPPKQLLELGTRRSTSGSTTEEELPPEAWVRYQKSLDPNDPRRRPIPYEPHIHDPKETSSQNTRIESKREEFAAGSIGLTNNSVQGSRAENRYSISEKGRDFLFEMKRLKLITSVPEGRQMLPELYDASLGNMPKGWEFLKRVHAKVVKNVKDGTPVLLENDGNLPEGLMWLDKHGPGEESLQRWRVENGGELPKKWKWLEEKIDPS